MRDDTEEPPHPSTPAATLGVVRIVAVVVTMVVGVAAVGLLLRSAPTTTTDQDRPDRVHLAASRGRLKVAVVGDSIAANLASGLRTWADTRQDVELLDVAVPGCPLARDIERQLPGQPTRRFLDRCGWWADETSEHWADRYRTELAAT